MRIIHFVFFTTSFLFLNLSKPLWAQENSLLKRVTINPSPLDVHESKSARSVSIITQQDIKRIAASSVEELLSNIEGINSNARGGFGVQNDVGMRGSTFSQVLVLIDNVRVNEPLTGHYNLYLPISLSEIQRIEIIRGPAASAYGADAVGGLIHIKTKSYLASAQQKNKELGSSGQLLLGENKLRIIDAMVDTRSDQLYFGGSVTIKSSTGQIFDNPNFIRDSSLDKNYRTDFDIKNYSLFANYFLNKKTKLFARASLNTRDFNAKYFYTNSTFDESVEKINTIWSQVGLQHAGSKQKTQVGVAFKKLDDEFIFNPLFSKNNHTTQQAVLYAQQQRKWDRNLQMAYGLQSTLQRINSTDRGDHTNNTHAAFASANVDFNAHWNLIASARAEYNTDYDFSFVPQIGIAYRPNSNVVFRSSVGLAHRAPDFTERYISNNLPSLSPGRNLGNPNLKTEKSATADIGFDYYTKREKLFSISVFARNGSNLIDYILTNSNSINTNVVLTSNENYFLTQNVSRALTYGLEANLSKRFVISKNSRLRFALNYTFIKTSVSDDEPSKYISNHPGHMANLQLGYETKHFDLQLINNYRNRQPETDVAVFGDIPQNYFVTNALLRIKLIKNKLNLIGKVLNVFDAQYQEILGAPMPTRWFTFGASWDF
jgi:iron complex outermembrane receptor protein